MLQSQPITVFLLGTFGLAGIAFILMFTIPGAQSPEGLPGLPVWLIAVWSPSVMALILAYYNSESTSLLLRLIAFKNIGIGWAIIAIPLIILLVAVVINWQKADFSDFTSGLVLMLIGLNLFLGPLGEELGWRGFLQPRLEENLGWFLATLCVSSIWAIWHAPLWGIASPQSEIPFYIFAIHVIAYGFLMASVQSLAPHSLVPAVLLHLLFNVSASVALLGNIADTERWYVITAVPYLVCAIVVSILVRVREGFAWSI